MKIIKSINNENLQLGNKKQLVIIHHTGSKGSDKANIKYLNKIDYISAHYLIGKDGSITQLVDDDRIAYHAGISEYKNIPTQNSSLNFCSIGIEVNSNGKDFNDKQRYAVIDLCRFLIHKYSISNENILRHKDIAPNRKIDIGDNFYKPFASTWSKFVNEFIMYDKYYNVSNWAKASIKKADENFNISNWEEPNEIIANVTVEHIFKKLGIFNKVTGNGVSKERFIVAMDRLNALNK